MNSTVAADFKRPLKQDLKTLLVQIHDTDERQHWGLSRKSFLFVGCLLCGPTLLTFPGLKISSFDTCLPMTESSSNRRNRTFDRKAARLPGSVLLGKSWKSQYANAQPHTQ